MAKNDDYDVDYNSEDEESGGGFTGILLAVIIIIIWLVIFALLIKMDVGGIGTMLRPFLKNVPVVNMILPEASDEEVAADNGNKYRNLAEAIERIKELEAEVENLKTNGSSEQISNLRAEIERLKTYEDNYNHYLELKEKFDRDIVFNNNAPDIENYKKWYEEISPDNAAKIYEDVIKRMQYTQQVKDWAEAYSKMEPAKAAGILEEMTGDTNLVAAILLNMTSKNRAAIMAEMDPIFAAKMTKIMYPN